MMFDSQASTKANGAPGQNIYIHTSAVHTPSIRSFGVIKFTTLVLVIMSSDILSLFDQLCAESDPLHLPVGGDSYKFTWMTIAHHDDLKADGY